jgi:hypothetical protein
MATEPTGTAPEPSDPASTDTTQEPDETKISVSEHNARAAKLRKDATEAKRRAEALEAKLAEVSAKLEEKDSEKLSETERLNKRLQKIEDDRKREVAEWQAKAESEKARRQSHLIRSALLEEIGKRGLYEPDLVAEILSKQVQVTDDDRVVRIKDDIESDISAVLDEFCKARPRFVPAPASGSGSRSGGPGTRKPKSFGEMTPAELDAAAIEELSAMSRAGKSA